MVRTEYSLRTFENRIVAMSEPVHRQESVTLEPTFPREGSI